MATGGANNTKLTLKGDRQLRNLLTELPPRVVKKGLRQGVSAGAAPWVKAAKQGASKESGLLKKSVTKKVKTYKSGTAAAIVGANRAVAGEFKGKHRVPANYLHLVTGGTAPHSVPTGKGGVRAHPGAKANDFLTEAFNGNQAGAAEITRNKIQDVLESEAAKLAGGGEK